MSKKHIGDYINYDFHTPNTEEVREYLSSNFNISTRKYEFTRNDEFITTSYNQGFVYTTDIDWGTFISTEDFKQLIGMIIKQQGYELADGTYSSEYKLGDKFEVVDGGDSGSIVVFKEDDATRNPHFIYRGVRRVFSWCRLKAYKPQQDVSTFTKASLKDGMIVTYRNEWERIVYKGELVWGAGKGSKLEYFKDTLLHINEEQMDIVKVMFGGELLWEREASPTEAELKQQRIAKELEFAEAKRERLNAHIERLKGNLENYNLE